MSTLAGKLALVTGASGEIGSAVARRLAQDGAHVIAHYGSNRKDADAVVRAIVEAGGEAEVVCSDLSLPNGVASLIDQVDRTFGGTSAGRLDVLVNNAGSFAFESTIDPNANVPALFTRTSRRPTDVPPNVRST